MDDAPQTTLPSRPTVPAARAIPMHQCIACPIEVRDLYACAANLVIVIEAVLNGSSGPARARKKLDELARSVAVLRPVVEAHFRDLEHHPNG